MTDNDARRGGRLRPRAALLHFAKCAGSSVAESLTDAVGAVAAPAQQFDRCYLAGFDRPEDLDPEVASTVAWNDQPVLDVPYAFHQHWSLPTLRRHFSNADIATVVREPCTRVLSHVLFTRAMAQREHRRWYPHRLPTDIARMPLVEVLQLPAAARVTDSLMVRQIMWGDSRIPAADFIAADEAATLGEQALSAVRQLGCVCVVETMTAGWTALERWLGAPLSERYDNRTRQAQVPGLLRKAADIDLAIELLATRSAADSAVWVPLAQEAEVADPEALAIELVDRKLRAIVRSAFLALRSGHTPNAAPDVLHLGGGHTTANDALLVSHRVGPSDATSFAVTIELDDDAHLGDALAGYDPSVVHLGPNLLTGDLGQHLQRLDAQLGEGYRFQAVVRKPDVSKVVLAAALAGWHLQRGDDRADLCELHFGRDVAPPAVNGEEPVTHYGVPIDVCNSTDSRAVVLAACEPYEHILEIGCSEGLMTRRMVERGQRVVGVEFDPVAAASAARWTEQIVVADVQQPDSLLPLGEQRFELVIVSDVLEHLREPADALRRIVEFVRPGGRLMVSVPNVAHADVRVALLNNTFPYASLGLLDRSHIHFFTYHSLLQLLDDCDLVVTEWRRTIRPPGDTEVPTDPHLVSALHPLLVDDPHATTYQWILTCARTGEGDAVPDPLLGELPQVDIAQRLDDPDFVIARLGVRASARAFGRSTVRFARRRLIR
jgi:2-polyprenyl-3-methyl-5-hydroxy-6-metoxy-1,4-benzoquinol methylase